MMPTRRMFRAIGGAASLVLVGCWTPAPYGYTTYPGYYGPPPNQGFVAPPGGTIVSPGVTYPPAPVLGPPSAPPGTSGWAPAPGPTPAPTMTPTPMGPPPSSGSLAPLPGAPQSFNNGPSTFSEPQVGTSRRVPDNPVPPPTDPVPRPSTGPSAGPPPSDMSPFGAEGKDSFDKGTQMEIPKRADGPQSVASREPEPFETPLDHGGKVDTGVVAVAAKTVDAKTRVEPPNRFDYDRASYSYLRGVVDFNPRNKTWHIVYSPNPDRKDKYGGAFELIDSPKLRGLRDGDVVFIQGRVHPQLVDSHGKPKYEVGDEVARVTYRNTQAVGN
jgi:hypothetical protein